MHDARVFYDEMNAMLVKRGINIISSNPISDWWLNDIGQRLLRSVETDYFVQTGQINFSFITLLRFQRRDLLYRS